MTFVRKFTRTSNRITALFTCPEHGVFELEVERMQNGEAPDVVACPVDVMRDGDCCDDHCSTCGAPATWTPSVDVACRVRRIEAVKGKWEPPARKTYLDTTDLAEGMDIDDFRAKRAAVWEEKRQQDVMAVKKGFG